MDRRNQPNAFWGDSLTFWCRLWQMQFEHALRFWSAMAEATPRPSAAELAAEAESVKARQTRVKRKPVASATRKPRQERAPARRGAGAR
ncbi:MAG: hypothetical protein HLUCCA12_15030 [Rhodobacteraceae bacterium HLUCCA12]|nr:MAG: hypothetical protein HLUCCA12_15030 [Rhodobacteraceae bacterium HLUCCA12]